MRKGLWMITCVIWLLFPGSMTHAQRGDGQKVNFNFPSVEISNLAEIVGQLTGKQFVIAQDVERKVSVVTPEEIPLAEVYPLFLSILESSGLTVIEKVNALHIVPLPESSTLQVPVIVDATKEHVGLVTKVIRLNHVSTVAFQKLIEPMVGGKGKVLAFGPTNHLLLTDTASNIKQIEKIVEALDKPDAGGAMEVIKLKHASATALSQQLTLAIRGAASAGKKVSQHFQQVVGGEGNLPTDVLIIPAEQNNSLIVVGSPIKINEVKRLIAELDIEEAAGRGRWNAIFLKYLNAEEAATSINALLAKKIAEKQVAQVALEPSPANNALLVDASPLDFEYIKQLVDSLDQAPEQVLVEVLIAEVSVSTNLDAGTEWATIDQPADGRTTFIGRSRPSETDNILALVTEAAFAQGIELGIARGTFTDASGNIVPRIPFLVRALSQDRNIKILSKVPLWAQNNTEAVVSVVQNIPILKSTIEGGAGTARDVIQNIERVDVGIKLSLTPLVNPNQEVTLKLNPSIEAIVDEGPADQLFTPTISKREVNTTVTVSNQQTVVISGLIREDKIVVENRVPFFGYIPILGWLFKNKQDQIQRTNLLIFVTPHIVTDLSHAKAMTEDWKQKSNMTHQLSERPAGERKEP